MKVLNIHTRLFDQPRSEIVALVKTLATENDALWPKEQWPAMRFKNGIQVGAKGGHGPIRYTVETYDPNKIIQFRFSKPMGFHGIHKFEVQGIAKQKTEVKHTIAMKTKGKGTFLWFFGIRALHNALIEDAFDKMESHFTQEKKTTPWNFWVRFLRSRA